MTSFDDAIRSLDPTDEQIAHVQQAVERGLDARSPSLVREWLDILVARPVANGALAAAAGVALALATPAGALAWMVLTAVTRA